MLSSRLSMKGTKLTCSNIALTWSLSRTSRQMSSPVSTSEVSLPNIQLTPIISIFIKELSGNEGVKPSFKKLQRSRSSIKDS